VARADIFAMRVTAEERRLIKQLAQREERTASDVVRRLIRKAAQSDDLSPLPSIKVSSFAQPTYEIPDRKLGTMLHTSPTFQSHQTRRSRTSKLAASANLCYSVGAERRAGDQQHKDSCAIAQCWAMLSLSKHNRILSTCPWSHVLSSGQIDARMLLHNRRGFEFSAPGGAHDRQRSRAICSAFLHI
jgi:hypothetical protein